MVSVLELPGLPTMNTGMRFAMQVIATKRFSLSASLRAMPSSKSMCAA